MIGLVWAQSADGVIGRDGTLPWRLPEDMAHFSALTRGTTVVMGRTTWESLPARYRPLPERRNVVLSRRRDLALEGAEVVHSVAEALDGATGDVWVIGGGQVYEAALPRAERLVVTEVDVDLGAEGPDGGGYDDGGGRAGGGAGGDVRAPRIGPPWRRTHLDPPEGWHRSRTGLAWRVATYEPDVP